MWLTQSYRWLQQIKKPDNLAKGHEEVCKPSESARQGMGCTWGHRASSAVTQEGRERDAYQTS